MALFDFLKHQKDREKKQIQEEVELQIKLSAQNEQIKAIQEAEESFEINHDIDSLITFWENIWSNGGLLFNGSKWTFRLPDLYIKQKRYDDAIKILCMIDNPAYQEKKQSYIERISSKIRTSKK